MTDCGCRGHHDRPQLVVVTGGPGAGKTALLEIVRQHLCRHVLVLPEAAGVVYGGGFPRRDGDNWRRAAQRAIFYVQRELERAALAESGAALVLCDRGTLDGTAYWPGGARAWAEDLGVDMEAELARYAAVIHLRTPPATTYNHRNPLRIEDALTAHAIDELIAGVWMPHPHHLMIESTPRFLAKIEKGVAAIEKQLPACCRVGVPQLAGRIQPTRGIDDAGPRRPDSPAELQDG